MTNPFIAYDQWLINRTRKAVEWCEEWLDVSQRSLEIGLMVAKVGVDVTINAHDRFYLGILVSVMFGSWLIWFSQLRSGAERTAIFRDLGWTLCRYLTQVFFGITMIYDLLNMKHFTADRFMPEASLFFYAVILYVLASSFDGERGRKRKLALAKLKEWFGSLDWLPQPQHRNNRRVPDVKVYS